MSSIVDGSGSTLRPHSPVQSTAGNSHKRPQSIRIPSSSSLSSAGEPTPSPKVPGRWIDPGPVVGRSNSTAKARGRRIASFLIPTGGPSPTRAEFAPGVEWQGRPRDQPLATAANESKRRTINFGRSRPMSTFEPSPAAATSSDPHEMETLVKKILYKAGEEQSAPILVLAPVHLPNNGAIAHSTLLPKLRERLESYESEYSVVLFTQPTPHPPPTSLLVSTYLALPRQTRKNVRRVYVVGGGWWVKLVTTVFTTTLLSGKTAKRKKLVQCATLSKLAEEMGTDSFVQLEIPPEAYAANTSHENSISLPTDAPLPKKMFGLPLDEVMGPNGENGLPRVVRDALAVIIKEAPVSVGIFRRSPSAVTVQVVREAYDRGHPVTLRDYPDDAFLAASLLKLYLRELPTPLISPDLYSLVREIPLGGGVDAQDFIASQVLPALDRNSRQLLRAVAAVLSLTAQHSDVNLMPVPNLLVCLGPCLVGGVSMESLAMTRVPGKTDKDNTVGGLLQVCIATFDRVFGQEPATEDGAADGLLQLKPISSSPLFEKNQIPVAPPTPPLSVENRSEEAPAVGLSTSSSTHTLHITADAEDETEKNKSPQVTVESPHMGDLGAEWIQAEGAFASERRMSRTINGVLGSE